MNETEHRKRGLSEDEPEQDDSPLAKRIRNLSLGNLGRSTSSAVNHPIIGLPPTNTPTATFPSASNNSHTPSNITDNHHLPLTTFEHTYTNSCVQNDNDLRLPTSPDASCLTEQVSTDYHSGVYKIHPDTQNVPSYQHYQVPGYDPQLSESENPHYYSINKVLYEAHVSCLTRRNQL